MTVRVPNRPLTRLETAQAHAEHVLGARKANRIRVFKNGALYVQAGSAAMIMAWLIDFTVYLFSFGVGVVALAVVHEPLGFSDDVVAVGALAMGVGVPLLYGLCYGNGRALGAVLAGTQLVRSKDGARIGYLKAPWAMLGRTLFMPLLLIIAMAQSLSGAGAATMDVGWTRVSIDPAATRQLYAARIL